MNSEFDVIVIGAGINGAGIARDAARRGLKVLLIDKSDIGGGTSTPLSSAVCRAPRRSGRSRGEVICHAAS